jgi:hypothetical protein
MNTVVETHQKEGARMSFFVGLLLFVVIVGRLDARLPWPRPRDPEVRS